MDAIYINKIENGGEHITIEGNIGKKVWNRNGETYHIGKFLIMSEEEYNTRIKEAKEGKESKKEA